MNACSCSCPMGTHTRTCAIRAPYTLSIYRFVGDQAFSVSKTKLYVPRGDALRALAAIREGLPSDHGATLVDALLHNVRPEASA